MPPECSLPHHFRQTPNFFAALEPIRLSRIVAQLAIQGCIVTTFPQSIRVDKCYRTKADLVRLITKIEGDEITYAPRARTAFDNWHETAPRRTMARRRFLSEAVEEIPYYWQPERDAPRAGRRI